MTDRAAEPIDDPLRSALGVVRRRLGWGAGVALVVVGLSVALVLLARPVYMADARLRLGQPPPSTGVSPTSGLLSFLNLGGDPFSNDLELLASRTLAETIVREAVLNAALDAPSGWHRDSIFAELALQDTTIEATYEATWSGDGSVAVERLSPRRAPVGTARAGEPLVVGGLRVAFLPRKEDGPASVRIKTEPFDEAVRVERQRVTVERTRREANLLEISYTHHDPAVAQKVLETAVTGFLDLRSELFERESTETMDSLRAVAVGTNRELRDAEEALEEIQRQSGIIAPDVLAAALIDRYETVLTTVLEARAERDAIGRQLVRVEATDDRLDAWSTLVAHPRFLENETMAGLVTRLTELEELQTRARSTLTPESREVRTLDVQVDQLHRALRTVVDEFLVGLGGQIEELERQLADADRFIEELPAQVVELGRRQRAVRVLTEVAVITETRLRQEELRLALAYSNVQVVDPPTLRFRPVWPRKKLGVAVGILLGGLAGLAAIVLVERADTRVRTASGIRAVTGAPVLAAPLARGGALSVSDNERAALADREEGRAWGDGATGAAGSGRDDAPAGGSLPGAGPAADDRRPGGRGPTRYVVLPGAEAHAGLLCRALGIDERRAGPVQDFADALAVSGSPVVLVLTVARTTLGELDRVTGLLREAGAAVRGTVGVCGSRRQAETLWA